MICVDSLQYMSNTTMQKEKLQSRREAISSAIDIAEHQTGEKWQEIILPAEGTYSLQSLEVNTLLPLHSLPGLVPSPAR